MPNWCENDLSISLPYLDENKDKKEYLKQFKLFKLFIKNEDDKYELDFNKILPCPNNKWDYDWCIENWSTKWGASDFEVINDSETEIMMSFSTAWSPPEKIIRKLGKLYPLLIFDLRYFECGVGYNGVLRIDCGEVTQNKEGEYFGNRGG